MDMRLIACGGFFAAMMAYVIVSARKTGRIQHGVIIDRRTDPRRFTFYLRIAKLTFLLGVASLLCGLLF
jgi:hypothetical protein